jgi:photosystem II stability/assembly factor-like uncharacterized protein
MCRIWLIVCLASVLSACSPPKAPIQTAPTPSLPRTPTFAYPAPRIDTQSIQPTSKSSLNTSSTPAYPAPMSSSISFPTIYKYRFVDAQNGWLQTLDGRLLRSEDEGHTWFDVTPDGISIADSFFLDRSTAWVTLANGPYSHTLYRTTDGGRTWGAFDISIYSNLVGFSPFLTFTDAQHGWAVGGADCSNAANGAGCPFPIYQTDDGGQTWSAPETISYPQALLPGSPKYGIPLTIQSPTTIWAASWYYDIPNPITFYLTRDASRTWKKVSIPNAAVERVSGTPGALPTVIPGGPPSFSLQMPTFLSDREGFFATVTQLAGQMVLTVYRTQDGGETWTPAPSPLTLPARVWGINLEFLTREDWYSACFNIQPSQLSICSTHDSGRTWQVIQPEPTIYEAQPPYFVSFQFINANNGWGVLHTRLSNREEQLALYHIQDDGRTWTPLNPSLIPNPTTPNPTLFPTAVVSGLPKETPTPAPAATSTPGSFPSLHWADWIDLQHGWALTVPGDDPARSNRLLKTTDGGSTWKDVTPPHLVTVTGNGIYFTYFPLDAQTLWEVRNPGFSTDEKDQIFHTTDGGQTRESFPAPFVWGTVRFFDTQHGWTVAVPSPPSMGEVWLELYRTSDAGHTWKQLTPPPALGGGDPNLKPGTFHPSNAGFSFQDARTIWLNGMGNFSSSTNTLELSVSRDDAETWQSREVQLPEGLTYDFISVVRFLNEKNGFFYASFTRQGEEGSPVSPGFLVFETTDGGATWKAHPSVEGVKIGDIQFVTPKDWFVNLYYGALLTHDGGQTWRVQMNQPGEILPCIPNFLDGKRGFALIGKLITEDQPYTFNLYQTVDGGDTCRAINPVLK